MPGGPGVVMNRDLLLRLLALVAFSGLTTVGGRAAQHSAEAVRLNNNGVALMNQQQTERAEAAFSQAAAKDPALYEAALNEGIALLYMQRPDEAQAALERAIKLDEKNPRGWYNLGLAQRSGNRIVEALKSFQHAAELDPADSDSLYFEGVCEQEEKQTEAAIATFSKALKQDSQHASSEFALARALQRSGHADEAKVHFTTFQHLTATKVAFPLGLSYGDQGKYSTALAVSEDRKAAATMIPVHFVVAAQAGVKDVVKGEGLKLKAESGKGGERATGAACWIDVDGDGIEDLVIPRLGAGSGEALAIFRRHADGGLEEVAAADAGLGVQGAAVSCAVGDTDADGLPDLAVALTDRVMLFHNQGQGKFVDVSKEAGIGGLNRPRGMTFVDFDHDGDLDLLISGEALKAGGPASVLWRNNGDGRFTDWTEQSGLGGSGATGMALLSDVNNDRAVDLIFAHESGVPKIFRNPREGKFVAAPLYPEGKGLGSAAVAAVDFNKDGWMDLLVAHTGAPGVSLWRNLQGKGFEEVPLPVKGATRGWGVTAVDVDNDGWVDIAALLEGPGGIFLHVFRNLGDGSFEDVSAATGLDRIPLAGARGLLALDMDGDGDADFLVTSTSGRPLWLRNDGGNRNRSVRLRLTGFADNKTAIGTKVEVVAGGLRQKWEVAGGSGYMTQGPGEILIGLGDAEGIDLLRLLWPTGVPQDEIDVPRQAVVSYKEADRRGSSCPVLFAWNGKKFVLVTDTIGAAVVGHWFTPERRNFPDSDEWIKVDGNQVAAVDGRLSLRFTEPMEEVNYIDQLRLKAIDHPEGTEVYPDEKFLDEPPFATGDLVVSKEARLPVAATDDEGRDVLPALAKADHKFVAGFEKIPYDGFAKEHRLTLDLGKVEAAAPLRLLMTGYVEYFSATSLYAAWQAGVAPISPYVEAQKTDGSWVRVDREMGFPAGLERTIVVDLTGRLPAGAHRIRIETNLQIYWDQVLVDSTKADGTEAWGREVPLERATMRFHGYPKQIDGDSPGDLTYDYDLVSLTGPFQRQQGGYTRFGDVTPLVKGVDNRFAIFGSGEEIGVEFDASKLPPLPPHWKRDYFFYANGYVKDMDYYDASPFTVSQLPFHGMSRYPYPDSEGFPADDGSVGYQLEWNDRFDRGEPSRPFRFDYRMRPSTPGDTGGAVTGSTVQAAAGSGD